MSVHNMARAIIAFVFIAMVVVIIGGAYQLVTTDWTATAEDTGKLVAAFKRGAAQ